MILNHLYFILLSRIIENVLFALKKQPDWYFQNSKRKKIYSLLLCLLFICASSEPIRAEQSKVKTNLATHLTLKIK